MMDEKGKRLHLRSTAVRDKDGNIRQIKVSRTEKPRFHTPAFDYLLENPIPRHLWQKRD